VVDSIPAVVVVVVVVVGSILAVVVVVVVVVGSIPAVVVVDLIEWVLAVVEPMLAVPAGVAFHSMAYEPEQPA
jgi:hypothetical protein